ncbi:MAG TPA: NAD(P)H-dependent oxidoreductase subunit E [Armatimonadota bacterium]|jgi:NADH:ubiquinone oxidoreductase subunit E
MVEVKVCLGSSCHIRGGAQTLKVFKSLIEAHELAAKVDLAAELCLENCLQAPNVIVNGTVFGSVTPERAESFFIEEILSKAESPE